VFFGQKRIPESVTWMLGLWTSIVLCTGAMYNVDALAGKLVAPTIGWVSVATALNVAIARLNPGGVPAPTEAERAAYKKDRDREDTEKRRQEAAKAEGRSKEEARKKWQKAMAASKAAKAQ